VLQVAHGNASPIRENDLDPEQIVHRQAVPGAQRAVAAAKRQTSHADGTTAAGNRDKTLLRGGIDDIPDRRTTPNRRHPSLGIDLNLPHRGQIDHQPIGT
jgi:hypothetical protein